MVNNINGKEDDILKIYIKKYYKFEWPFEVPFLLKNENKGIFKLKNIFPWKDVFKLLQQ